MAPKKGKSKAVDTVDGTDTSKMSREQLEHYAKKILEEMERVREECNFFQLERDKIRTFWEITRNQLHEAQATVRNKEREKEELMEKHEEDLVLQKQKVKHLMYDHQTNLSETKADHMVALKMAQDEHVLQENELLNDKKDAKRILKEMELAHENDLRALKLAHAEEMNKILKRFEGEAIDMEKKYEQKLITQYESMILKHRMEIKEVEERKESQVTVLTNNHETAFSEMKQYYNDIVHNNLSLIESLKDQMDVCKNHEERMSIQVRQLTNENKKMFSELKEAQSQVADLTKQLINYEKDKRSLANTKRRLATTMQNFENLKWENEVLELRFEKCQAERDELHSRFVSSILELQQKTGLKNVLLEKKLKALSQILEQRETQISEVLSTTQSNPEAVLHVNNKLEDILNRKNAAIEDLQYELAKACKAHDDLLTTYKSKLKEYGIAEKDFNTKMTTNQMISAKIC